MGPQMLDPTPPLGSLCAPLWSPTPPWRYAQGLCKVSPPSPDSGPPPSCTTAAAAACGGAIGRILAFSVPSSSPDCCVSPSLLFCTPSLYVPLRSRPLPFPRAHALWTPRHPQCWTTIINPSYSSSVSSFINFLSAEDSSPLAEDALLVPLP